MSLVRVSLYRAVVFPQETMEGDQTKMIITIDRIRARNLLNKGTKMDIQDPSITITVGDTKFNTARFVVSLIFYAIINI